ncbi:Hypothetical predicted protein, partial [Marmota monax]
TTDCVEVCVVQLRFKARSTVTVDCILVRLAVMGSLTHHEQDGLLEDTSPKDSYLIPRNIMAEPDYMEDDNPELIRPQKLINPVKTSRNHQDLHRELLMNQKRYHSFWSMASLQGF